MPIIFKVDLPDRKRGSAVSTSGATIIPSSTTNACYHCVKTLRRQKDRRAGIALVKQLRTERE
jgi:hypothetical protein